ncbi:3-oxoacyl-ACP reductase [Flavobacterium sp. PL02]|uniref:3-oxoacyl-ACP reductase n=1 Tax=Flavobacterium sp. PL02 TaxID=3088354 RepID=UPI002B22BC7B|nr:3-oxoacyl-ACP reductase [Flavobacterium sp. PL02]MEA9415225.1 hypothetical protein [Flavobacterium sp. PL02]
MKTSITTIALFSLALVATSFTTPETTKNISLNAKSEIIPPIDGGGSAGGGRKQDIYIDLSIDGGGSAGGGRKQDNGYMLDLSATNSYRQPIDGGGSAGGGRKQD